MSSSLPYGRHCVSEQDIQAVVDVLRGDWLTCGPAVTQFEDAVREYIGVKHAIAVSNGTAALHLCCMALGIRPGDTGITSALTFLASANCIAYCGGRPDFVDIDPITYCLNPDKLEEHIQKNGVPRVVIPVDFAGVPSNLPRIHEMSRHYGFAVIEDAAHSLGSSYSHNHSEIRCGACVHSDLAIFSFHPVKTVTAGEGGMVLTNNDELAHKVRMLASHGMERDVRLFHPWPLENTRGRLADIENPADSATEKAPWLYQQQALGYNYRITDIQCALGASQFKRLSETVERRFEIFNRYQQAFSQNNSLIRPPHPDGTAPAYHLYVLRFKDVDNTLRFKACSVLRKNGIFAQVHYIPVYLQPWYQQQFGYKKGKCPVSEEVYENCLSIPLYPAMKDSDVERVISIINGLTP
ncbi:MAG: UDP-4-amino-4,6-dideoxy-N-acetyl-beta-L-altrosamine transaminase [Verrucomicrobia bacterium]|nr:UDP-4-amino-4,6-dideoxy-N-acetyl-beta-L-altrosamine transaminase [Verrucomicrobiota bacterium]